MNYWDIPSLINKYGLKEFKWLLYYQSCIFLFRRAPS